MKYIWSCICGEETKCTAEDMQAGAIWHCDSCNTSFGCVHRKAGPKVWITVNPSEVEFFGLWKMNDDRKRQNIFPSNIWNKLRKIPF
jgi:hypothetical protein